MPAIARKGDMGSEHEGFAPTAAIEGSADVEIDGLPALRVGDALAPHDKPKNPAHSRKVAQGSPTVFVNGLPAARIGDAIDCGGTIEAGSGTVSADDG